MQRTKDTSFVKFDDILTLLNVAGDSGHRSKTYKLSGMIIHVGETTQSGHYIAITRRGGKWVTFNDEVVLELDKLDLKQYDLSSARRPGCQAQEYCSQSVYMLVYEDASEQCVPLVAPLIQSVGNTTESSRITDFFNRTQSENTDPTPNNALSNGVVLTNSEERGSESRGTESRGTESRGTESRGTESRGTESRGTEQEQVPPPADILSDTVADNEEFEQLRELLMVSVRA